MDELEKLELIKKYPERTALIEFLYDLQEFHKKRNGENKDG